MNSPFTLDRPNKSAGMAMNHSRRIACLAALAASVTAALAVAAEPPRNPRGVFVEEVRNDQPAFLVRVDVDRPNRVFFAGEELRVRVKTDRDGYLYLLYCDAANQVSCLFPNAFETDNRIAANKEVVVPQPVQAGAQGFRIKVGAPFGEELLKAIVCTEPLPPATLAYLMKAAQATAARGGARGAIVEQVKSANWAEHHVAIVSKDSAASTAPAGPRRIALCIGISDFADEQIRDLAVGHRDASAMAEVLQQRCGFERAWVLANEQASRKNIEHAICRQLPSFTRPGDTVVIYWSGHGARCADTDGDEKDGFDEYLVPHDGQLTDAEAVRRTMILDDTFGRWLQELDGRRVLVILDTCHSGGQGQEKSIKPLIGQPAAASSFDFLDGELQRIKDIGQRETALLASSAASQVSFERREGDLSTMTYFLLAQLQAGSEPLELREVHARLQSSVAEYVEKAFPGTTQTPLLMDNLAAPLLLRPAAN
jgi:hypothetical protein